jgi:hypothetical protein
MRKHEGACDESSGSAAKDPQIGCSFERGDRSTRWITGISIEPEEIFAQDVPQFDSWADVGIWIERC